MMTFDEFVRLWLWGCMMCCPDERWNSLDPDLRVSALMALRPGRA